MVLEKAGTGFQDHSLKKYVKKQHQTGGDLWLPQKGESAPIYKKDKYFLGQKDLQTGAVITSMYEIYFGRTVRRRICPSSVIC